MHNKDPICSCVKNNRSYAYLILCGNTISYNYPMSISSSKLDCAKQQPARNRLTAFSSEP